MIIRASLLATVVAGSLAWAQVGLQVETVRAVDRSDHVDPATEGIAVDDAVSEWTSTEPLVVEEPVLDPVSTGGTVE